MDRRHEHASLLAAYRDGYETGADDRWHELWQRTLSETHTLILGDRRAYLRSFWHGLTTRRSIERTHN